MNQQGKALNLIARGTEQIAEGVRLLAGTLPKNGVARRRRALTDYAAEALKGGKQLKARELADAVRGLGFHHSHQPRDPNQLEKSLAAMVSRDSRFTVVTGKPGVYTLA